jgi:hypothetical protein
MKLPKPSQIKKNIISEGLVLVLVNGAIIGSIKTLKNSMQNLK